MFWLFFAVMVTGGVVGLFMMPGSTPKLDRRRYPEALSVLEPVWLNGSRQWLLIRSEDIRNPVLLFVHGGPGTSMLGLMRRNTRALEKYFTVVNWDQRGAGKSYAAGSSASTMSEYVADLIALAQLLTERFAQDKIVLVGHSWGSAIGVLAASERPDLFSAYIGVGQMSNSAESERSSYAWTLARARARKHKAGLAKLSAIGPPPYTGANWQAKFLAQRSLLARYGGEYRRSRVGALGAVLRNVCSREYTMRDRLNYFRGILRSLAALGPELSRLNLFVQVPELEVPVYFCLGRGDHEVPSKLSAAYLETLKAPRKQLIWFESSAHLPNVEQRNDFNRFMIQVVRPALAQAHAAPPTPAPASALRTPSHRFLSGEPAIQCTFPTSDR